jgi:hypothetical protein
MLNSSLSVYKHGRHRQFLFLIGRFLKPVTAICLLADHTEMGNLYRGASIDISYQVSVHLEKWFQRRFFLNFIPPFSIFSLATILVESRDHRTQLWKAAIQGLLHQSLVILGWSPSKIVSGISDLRPRWPPQPNLI